MPVVGGGNDDGVYRRVGEDVAEILEGFAVLVAVRFIDFFLSAVGSTHKDVANANDVSIWQSEKGS